MRFVAIVDEGYEYTPSIQRREFNLLQEMEDYINSKQCFDVLFCGKVYEEYELKPKEVITKYELKKV